MLNVAVVGIGWWGKTLVPLLKRSNKLRVVKIVEVNAAAVADFARTHGVEVVSDYAEVLKDPAIQGVVLCTPHTMHTDQIVEIGRAHV